MAATFKYIISILFLNLIMKGSCYCNLNNINIGTTRSGRQIQGKPEWNVVVKNNCNCTQSQIRLNCKGFQTLENVSPSILSVQGDICLLINGNPLNPFTTVSFSYVWDLPFAFIPSTSHTTCS
ncbi:hypothetical protein VNO78_21540 [Psophocarpus tetragonolobus]|uniref:Uncharacterized protein n=1 Tax=Psophocarpus tetragonolobus TaxID=3891 RepID=A0AAN9SB91_PSOTE